MINFGLCVRSGWELIDHKREGSMVVNGRYDRVEKGEKQTNPNSLKTNQLKKP